MGEQNSTPSSNESGIKAVSRKTILNPHVGCTNKWLIFPLHLLFCAAFLPPIIPMASGELPMTSGLRRKRIQG